MYELEFTSLGILACPYTIHDIVETSRIQMVVSPINWWIYHMVCFILSLATICLLELHSWQPFSACSPGASPPSHVSSVWPQSEVALGRSVNTAARDIFPINLLYMGFLPLFLRHLSIDRVCNSWKSHCCLRHELLLPWRACTALRGFLWLWGHIWLFTCMSSTADIDYFPMHMH